MVLPLTSNLLYINWHKWGIFLWRWLVYKKIKNWLIKIKNSIIRIKMHYVKISIKVPRMAYSIRWIYRACIKVKPYPLPHVSSNQIQTVVNSVYEDTRLTSFSLLRGEMLSELQHELCRATLSEITKVAKSGIAPNIITIGVPQGGVLSPVLFPLYTSDCVSMEANVNTVWT